MIGKQCAICCASADGSEGRDKPGGVHQTRAVVLFSVFSSKQADCGLALFSALKKLCSVKQIEILFVVAQTTLY